MSANGVILPISWADGQTVIASSEASSDLAAENLLNLQPSEPWRSDGEGSHTLTGGFGQTRPCSVATLWAHNLTSADTATLELANDPGFSSDLVQHQWPGRYAMYSETGPVGGDADAGYKAPFVVGVFPTVDRAYWRWTVSRDGGYSQVGRMMIGLGWQPEFNFDWGLDIGWQNPSVVHKSMGGQGYVQHRPFFRAGHIRWSWLDSDDANVWDDITYVCSKGSTVLIIPYPDDLSLPWARRKTVLARILDHSAPREEEHGYTASTQIEEVL